MKLTKRVVDNFQYSGSNNRRCVLWDNELKGFGVRCYPSGQKAFILSYRTQGRKRLMKLGKVGVKTVDQARVLARKHLSQIESENKDPLEDRQKIAQGKNVKDLSVSYIERHAMLKKKTWQEDQRRIDRHIIPAWGNRRASSITRNDAAEMHNRIGCKAPYEANRTLRLAHKMFELAQDYGYVDEGHLNPARKIEYFSETTRDRWVTPDEMPKLFKAISEEENELIRSALILYLLTGARKSELLNAKWAHIDWDRKELRLEDTKAGRTHHIPLSTPAIEILKDMPRINDNPFIFCGHIKGRPLVNLTKPWDRVRTAAGIADVRLHDLRRTVGSWLAQSGNSLPLIGKILNHSNVSTTAIYARLGEDQSRQALERHGKKLMSIAGKERLYSRLTT